MNVLHKELQLRIYYEDTDHGGVVYYANYLKFMERARTEFLREIGLDLVEIEATYGVLFAVREAHIQYHTPARFNELIEVQTTLISLRGAALAFKQLIFRHNIAIVSATIQLACINSAGKATRVPAPLSDQLNNYIYPESV
ncbi:MAG: tol-pal system-associated acyl-CoA thioesterase [Mariprofundus sp.]|nr:tol-pal system-associated acyl-CoA thioesterase [Mariprofundus sp.]